MDTMMRRFTVASLVVAGLLSLSWITGYPGSLLDEAAGTTSQTLCSKVFVSDLDPDDAFNDHLLPEPGMKLIAWAITRDVDRTHREVRTRIAGLFPRRSVYADGRGCTLTYPGYPEPAALPPPAETPTLLPEIAGPDVVVAANPAVAAAINQAFEEPSGDLLRTKAVVIVHDGHVIGERYARGVTPQTRLLSHSIAKSVVNAMAGVLAREGQLNVSDHALRPAWSATSDARGAITIENLMRMNAGFGFDEGGGSSAATQLWYRQPDTAKAAAQAKLIWPVGSQWGYSSRSYALLARIVEDRVGGTPQALRDFAWREILGPLGMTSFTPEFDAAGTYMGGQASLATPRDWAKLGLLYLNDGVIGGKRILPEGWVKWSTTPTPGSGYGAGFWLNTTSDNIGHWGFNWGIPGAPSDAYMARGYMGQYIIIVPSAKLVVVRFGQSHGKGAGIESAGALVKSVEAALAAR